MEGGEVCGVQYGCEYSVSSVSIAPEEVMVMVMGCSFQWHGMQSRGPLLMHRSCAVHHILLMAGETNNSQITHTTARLIGTVKIYYVFHK